MLLFNNVEIPFGSFPNEETYIKKAFFTRNKADVKNVVTFKYESDIDLFRLFLVRKSLWFPCDLHITYFPYSRMDRSNDTYVFTLKSVAKYINMMEWDRVTIYEPHSDVTPALINRCDVVNVTAQLVKDHISLGNTQVFYPDAGAHKRYATDFESPTDVALIGFKTRNFETGRITGLTIMGERSFDRVVIVDDLCSKGGTFTLAATKLNEMGFRYITLVVAHCENTIFEGDIFRPSSLIDEVITTDSILSRSGYRPNNLTIFQISSFK